MGYSYFQAGAILPIDLTSQVSGSLPMANLDTVTVANGGTGLTALGAALQHLRTNAGAAALEYAAPPNEVTLSDQEDILAADGTTTSTSYVATLLSIVIANRAGGSCLCIATVTLSNSNNGASTRFVFFDDGVALTGDMAGVNDATRRHSLAVASIVSLNGSTINLRFKVSSGTGSIVFASDVAESKMIVEEIS